jgi:hypothetical protein
MSELSAIELKILENLVDCLESTIGVKMLNYTDKDRLLYVSCTNEVEKEELTKTQIKKLQKKVNKCSSEIAPYIMEVLRPNHPHNKDFDDLRKSLCQNYLLDFPDELSYISENYKTIESVPEDFDVWDIILFRDNIIYNTDNNISFVKFMAMAERLTNYKNIIEYNENNKTDNNENKSKFSNESFNQFIKDLEYNYPLYHTPLSSYHQWKTNLKYLKHEILSNLIILTDEAKKPYLKKLLFTLQEHYKYVHTVKSDVDELYNSYNTNEHQLLHQMNYTNELHIVLNNEPKKYEFPTEETFKINPFHIQERFYNYHYGVTIREAVEFIKFQEMEYGYRDKIINETIAIDVFKTDVLVDISFDSLSEYTQTFILNMLEALGITVANKSILPKSNISPIRGVIDALVEKNITPKTTLKKLVFLIAKKIDLEIKDLPDVTKTSDKFKKDSLAFIKNNYTS